jgi:hypothetical protein
MAAQPGAAADLAFGLLFSLVCSSMFRCILELSLAQSTRQLSAKPLGHIYSDKGNKNFIIDPFLTRNPPIIIQQHRNTAYKINGNYKAK